MGEGNGLSANTAGGGGGGVRVGQRQSSGRIEEGQRGWGGACHQGRGGLPVGASGGAPLVGLLEGSRPRCSSRATALAVGHAAALCLAA